MSSSRAGGADWRALLVDEALLNHLELPAQLPQRQDEHLDAIEDALLGQAIAAARVMRDLPENPGYLLWDAVRRSLAACRSVIAADGRLERSALLAELRHVAQGGFLFLHIKSQNAGILLQQYPG